jgi:dihydrofolate reductase
MVIGGGAVYAALAPHLDALHLTIVHHAFDTDTHLRDVPAGCWEVEAVDTWPRDDANDWPCTVLELRRWTRASRGTLAPSDLAALVHARPGDRF